MTTAIDRRPLLLKELGVTYPGRTERALHPCNLILNPGSVVVVQGPSGAGKSTLLKAILGLIGSSGEANLAESLVSRPQQWNRDSYSATIRAARRGISWVGQASDLCDHATALTNVCHGRLAELSVWQTLCRRFPASTRSAAARYLETLGLAEDSDRLIRHLSGGQRQRVAICRALIQDSDWIFADEPFSALDHDARDVALQALLAARDQGRGLLMVLHDTTLAKRIADRHIFITNGVLSEKLDESVSP